MMVNESHPLIFMHIPKTGGMSMFAGLCKEYGTNIADMYNMTSADVAPAAEVIQNPSTSIYCGHFPFGLHEWFTRPSYYAAVLREPVSRVLSLYFYIVQYRLVIHRIAQVKKMSLGELFSTRNAPDYYEDFLPWIEGEESLGLFLDCPSAELDNGMVRRFSGFGLKEEPCPREALDQARENIERYFSAVGVLEQYPKTLGLLRETFEWPWLQELRVNVGSHARKKEKPQVADDLRKRIAAMNELDTALYEWVVERFEKHCDNPTPPVLVDGAGRTDFEHLRLWKAVGRSPLREAAMKSKGVPQRPQRHAALTPGQFITPPIA
jgi:hypothetical protein